MHICVIPGDGIGPEVIGASVPLLHALIPAVTVTTAEAGWATFQEHGTALPAATLAAAQAADAILFGAVASPSHPVAGYRSPIVQLRRALDLYANIRPVEVISSLQHTDIQAVQAEHASAAKRLHPSVFIPHPSLVVVRENTEGLYVGRERLEDNGDTAIAECVVTRRASARIVRRACELARRHAQSQGRPAKLTIVHKANVLRISDGLFRTVALEVAADYPELQIEELLVDVAAMHLARTPQRFDVIVTTNLYGDILSDIASIHGGGLGLAPSANLGARQALFEPVHGAAPDIAGRGIANPLAAFRCVELLLQSHGLPEQAARLHAAIAHVIRHGPHTPDMGGTATTAEVGETVLAQIQSAQC